MKRSMSVLLPTRRWRQPTGQARSPELLSPAWSWQCSFRPPQSPRLEEHWRSTSYWHYLGGEWQGERPRGAARQPQGVQLMCTKGSGLLLPWGLPGWPYSPSPAVLGELGHPEPGIRIFLSLRCSEHSQYPECEQQEVITESYPSTGLGLCVCVWRGGGERTLEPRPSIMEGCISGLGHNVQIRACVR